ncbi:tail assembly protein [Pararobbsia silviterrae]|uniref:Tail assembly protein n=1 Tax=Pararobbsia silviterrae TaxID=1792498 RepID=A0A494X6H9_9BURK|nr:tail assembly protein [Pararobbsia silviterrae]RKP43804.1 tail assembly protein [Pararobbsia silviterrae]
MNEKVRTIRLYGKLGARFGRVHRFVVRDAAGAFRALRAMLPGFERELMTSKHRGVAYAVFLGRRNLSDDQLGYPCGDDDIRIAPILQGSKNSGLFQTIAGAALIVIGAITYAYGGAAIANVGLSLIGTGASLALGGIVQMLSPQQKGLSTQDSADNGASYNFNGPVNTQAQGNPVPVLYGRMIVGSAVISAGIYAEDQQ